MNVCMYAYVVWKHIICLCKWNCIYRNVHGINLCYMYIVFYGTNVCFCVCMPVHMWMYMCLWLCVRGFVCVKTLFPFFFLSIFLEVLNPWPLTGRKSESTDSYFFCCFYSTWNISYFLQSTHMGVSQSEEQCLYSPWRA